MTEAETPTSAAPSQWCLTGNIVARRPYGEGGAESKEGTVHFAPGAKVYCLPAQWGDGYDKIVAVGRHRGSKQFVRMVIRSSWVTDWRAKVVYHPRVLALLNDSGEARRNWASRAEVEDCAAHLRSRTA